MTGAELDVALKYLIQDRDRHGNLRRYVRVPGRKKIRLREDPDTEEFLIAYNAAVAGAPASGDAPRGSFRALCILYYGSGEFLSNDESTQGWQRRALDSIAMKHGTKPARLMQPRHVRRIRDEIKETPAAANLRVKAIKAMFRWATENDEAEINPAHGVKHLNYSKNPHHTATPEEIETYKARHPLGTKARLAFDLLRYTTGRREDIPLLGPGHLRTVKDEDGTEQRRIRFRQQKNKDRKPVDVDMPLHPELAASIAACPSTHMTFLVHGPGKPYTTGSFGNAMRKWFDAAGLPQCSAHSLRKSTPTEMAENNATPHEIMAITGHRTLAQVETYTREADRRKLADSGMKKVK